MQTPSTSSSEENSSGGSLRLLRRIPTKHLLIVGGLLVWGVTVVIHRAITKLPSAQEEASHQQHQATSPPTQAVPQSAQQDTSAVPTSLPNAPQIAPDPNLTFAQEARRQADAEFFKHWVFLNDNMLIFIAKDGTHYEVQKMGVNKYFFPIEHVDKLNGVEVKVRFVYSAIAFRYTKDGQTTQWLSGDPGYIAMHPMAPKPPATIVYLEKKNGSWSAQTTLPMGVVGEAPTLDDIVEKIRRGPVPPDPFDQ